MDQTVQDRLLLFIDHLKVGNREFSREIGMSEAFVSTVNNGVELKVKTLINILTAYPSLNVIWLLHGKGNMLLTDKKHHFNDQPEIAVKEPEMRYLDNEMGYMNKINEMDIEIQTLYKVIRLLAKEELTKEEIVLILNKKK